MKIFRVIDKTTFREKILKLGSPTEIAKKLGISKGAVSKWTNRCNPTSANIENLMEQYNLSCTELGVKEDEYHIENKSFQNRLKELLQENELEQKDLATSLDVTEATVSNWLSKGCSNLNTVKRIADYFDIPVLYLIGESDIKFFDVKEIAESLNCTEALIEALYTDVPSTEIDFLGQKLKKQDLGEGYWDLKDSIFADPIFLQTLKFEADGLISYYNNEKYRSDFEDTLNTMDIYSQTISTPIRFEPEDKAHCVISKVLFDVFDRYVDKKLLESGITQEMKKDILIKGVK